MGVQERNGQKPEETNFVLGVDLDGVCADFIGSFRPLAAEWLGVPEASLTLDVAYGFPEWGLDKAEYQRIHRWAITQRQLFANMKPIDGAAPAIRRLSQRMRIRIITHRLFIEHFHTVAVTQTVGWLDYHGIPYWDLCFMKDKRAVGADLYVEDSPENIDALRDSGEQVIVFGNSTNRSIQGDRAESWQDAETLILAKYDESSH